MTAGLSAFELSIYILSWTGFVVYSMYKCHLASDKYSQYLSEDLVPGWQWLGRKADTADFEWKMWTPIFFSWLKYVTPYLIISLVLRKKYPQSVPLICILISFSWLCKMLGLCLTFFLFLQPVLFYWILMLFSMKVVWLTCIGFTLALHVFHVTEMIGGLFEENTTQDTYFFAVILSWTHVRSISFLADNYSWEEGKNNWKDFYHYCFYLPLLPSGPMMLYKEFKLSIEKIPSPERTWIHLMRSLAVITRYLFWRFFHELALHYFYHSALQYNIAIVRRLDVWSAAGLGYSLGQFFMTKYVVMYGVSSALARLDHVDAPPPPKCVGRIHLYSQMWRDFDRGLYNFMVNYIYVPCKRTSDLVWSKLAGTALCFGFVCIWHGASVSVLVWCVANYLGICLETTAKYLSTRPPFVGWKTNWSDSNWLRFQAAIASPLLLMSALSNFCFFTDANVGYVLARKAVYEGGILRLSCILFAMYCCCHVSMALGRRKQNAKFTHNDQLLHQE
uniref:EOG090X06SF n=1 Tax=Simocephalus serrulatus TaxID=117539 RepID=A0A4Y7NQ81_9CRUS|nr:EOG090X06SF [Simocephalus serrulatus]